jgi:hypothetical protein
MAGWTLAAVTLALSLTAFLGFGIWLLPWPVAVVILVLALKRGIKGQGIALLITAILLVPLSYVAQFGSLAVYGTSAMMEQEWQETQVLQNLRALATAKAAWVTETEAKNGAPVMMVTLTSYLGGKEMMPVVDERYDPRPVGQEPTATLPEGKHFWDYPTGGGAYTALGLEQILSERSHNPVNMAVGQFLHPSEKWLPLFWESSPVVAPSVTPAPPIAPDE